MSTAWIPAAFAGKFVGPVPQGDPAAVRSPDDGTSGVSTGPATPTGRVMEATVPIEATPARAIRQTRPNVTALTRDYFKETTWR